MKHIEKFIAIAMLIFAIGFNLWLYRNEPTAKVDPNDNAFQYALVDRTNEIWNYADKTYLIDHWVPNWAEGYNLPYYYSHIPQILIVGSYRLFCLPFKGSLSLFQYYHIFIYLLLSLFPLSMFAAMRILKLPWLTAGIAALLASHISTDGLYGLDQSSYLWRGWGLSSQLFAAIFFPLAIASMIRFFQNQCHCEPAPQVKQSFFRSPRFARDDINTKLVNLTMAIIFLVATTAGHLGIGMMAFLAIPIIAVTPMLITLLSPSSPFQFSIKKIKQAIVATLYITIPSLILLSYWILPAFLNNNFHNISVWDPVWKFNSYGIKEVLVNLWNGNLFDFGRLPIFTVLVLIGAFICAASGSVCHCERSVAISKIKSNDMLNEYQHTPYLSLTILFIFFLFLYFGRTTWGNILNFIPGMSEFHQHRFIVGVHLIGLFLAPIGFTYIVQMLTNLFFKFKIIQNIILLGATVIICSILYKQTIAYSEYNDVLIKQANKNYDLVKPDVEDLIATIKKLPPGRIYAGRGGNWGRDFRVAETPMYMHLSTYGIPTILWLPETWSLNSDTEQYFDDNNESHYELYNISYVVTPINVDLKLFWKLIKETKLWKLYEVQIQSEYGSGSKYISVGISPSVVFSDKQSFLNLVHLWIQSPYPSQYIFPRLTLDSRNRVVQILPNFTMLDKSTYQTPDGKQHSLFAEPPTYLSAEALAKVDNLQPTTYNLQLLSQSSEADIVFSATVNVPPDCQNCVAILKQTYHPNWQAMIDNRPIQTFSVFPFFTAVSLTTPGTHTVTFTYKPSTIKILLFFGSMIALCGIVITFIRTKPL